MRSLICAFASAFFVAASCFVGSERGDTEPARQAEGPAAVPVAAAKPVDSVMKKFMRQKLKSSNQILEGLVVDDMTMVTAGADILLNMSVEEHWRASNDMLYLQHSRTFRDSVKTLKKKAKKNSIDGVALAWMDVTLNCIQCHEWVRNVLITENADTSLLSPSEQVSR